MEQQPNYRPPRWAERFLEWYCRPEMLEDLQGDLHEYFQRNIATKGLWPARLIYIIDAFKFFRSYTVRQPKITHPMNHLSIIRNYFKTSFRSLGKNKLFSAINVFGMAISMSVGLLLIAFVAELKTFDTFHANYDRIYRVINTWQQKGETPEGFASTSILAGKKIRELVPGIDDAVLINRDFSRDLVYEGKTLPFEGLWASESFFRVFSFELLSGNAETALKDPYSLVLTETAAQRLFGYGDVTGKMVGIDGENYTITGLMKDPPKNAHLQFEMLGSLITADHKKQAEQDENWLKWTNMWSNYVYLLLPQKPDLDAVNRGLAAISREENSKLEKVQIQMGLQPLRETVVGRNLSNEIGFNIDQLFIWILTGLALVVMLSACFNYTNLSIARALRRSREVGIRKVAGASRRQVFLQFTLEAVLIALFSLVFSYFLFLLIRPGFLAVDAEFLEFVTLRPALKVYLYFGLLAIGVGVVAGFFPALFFSRIDPVRVIKDISKLKLLKHINVRKGLITFQYILSICFIVAVSIGYKQYKYSLNFDLGFSTENILNINLKGNPPALLTRELAQMPEITGISASLMVPSVGNTYSSTIKYLDPGDSTHIYYNYIDEHYLPLHEHEIIAGENFRGSVTEGKEETEVIVNEKTLERFQVGTPAEAIGKELLIDRKKLRIAGVVRDFHYSKVTDPIHCFAFRSDPSQLQVLNLKTASSDMAATMQKIEAAWKKIDAVHPFEARFYDEEIERAYDSFTIMIKIIGFLAFLAISIASFGLLGMVVFTTETRLKEVSIRKVLGATEGRLVLMLSRGFLLLLSLASLIAIPVTYYLFDKVLFAGIAFRAPIGFWELFSGAFVVIGIALLAISSQTIRIARANPATTLGSE